MPAILILEYRDPEGRSPYAAWFDGLNAPAAAKIAAALYQLATGNLSNIKGVGSGVLERKIDFGPGYRIYFGRDGDSVVIRPSRRRKSAGPIIAAARARDEQSGGHMALTRDFRDTVVARVQRDPRFREALFTEAMNAYLGGGTPLPARPSCAIWSMPPSALRNWPRSSTSRARACTGCLPRAATRARRTSSVSWVPYRRKRV
jgi:putative addiction module killer protein